MKRNKEHIPSMQVEVWKMKDRVYQETKKMNCREFFSYIKNKCKKFNSDRKNSVSSSFRAAK
jgi:hypothetical protein